MPAAATRDHCVSAERHGFIGTAGNKVTAIVKKDGKTEIRPSRRVSSTERSHIHKGTLYIAEFAAVSKIENIENALDKPPKPTVIYTDLPKTRRTAGSSLRLT
jgi:hypothetical protein